MTFIDMVAPKGAVFGSRLSAMSTYEAAGPLRCEHAFRSFLALQSPELNASHKAKIFVWRFRNFFRWMRRNFFSETSLVWSQVSRASRWSKLISRYNGSCDFPAARRFSPRYQPSMSLFVLIDFMKTLHDDGGHVRLVIQVLPTYCMKSWSFRDSGISSRRAYISGISSAGRNGKAMTFLIKAYVPRSLV